MAFTSSNPADRRRMLKNVFFGLGLLAALIFFILAFFLFEFEKPQLTLKKEVTALGGKVEIPIEATDQKSGLRLVRATLSQGAKTAVLAEKSFPRQAWFGEAGPRSFNERVLVEARKAGFEEGEAELVITVRDYSLMGFFAGNKAERRMKVMIDTKPPTLAIVQAQRAIRPGGSGVAVYTVSEPPSKHGVWLGQNFFPGFPTQQQNRFIAYFALPWNAKESGAAKVSAADEAGNEVQSSFSLAFKTVPDKKDRIQLSDAFLEQKVPEFQEHYPEMKGDLLEKYLYVNNEVRTKNAESLAKLCAQPVAEQLWKDRFVRMPGAGKAGFADQRTYFYKGKEIDQQTHLGVDIASTERVAIKAANRGKVVMAEYHGIYGNTVVLDHGQGVFSLYSHLSSIDANVGALVEKDQLIGHSGTSGMAGGDHLHFSMLVHGIFVTPIEWWDQHWIEVNIKSALNEK